jgi:hypothetical protein
MITETGQACSWQGFSPGSAEAAVAHEELAVDPAALGGAEELDQAGGVLGGAEAAQPHKVTAQRVWTIPMIVVAVQAGWLVRLLNGVLFLLFGLRQLGEDARDIRDSEFPLDEAVAELEQVVQPVDDAAAAPVQAKRLARGRGMHHAFLPGVVGTMDAADSGVRVDAQVL